MTSRACKKENKGKIWEDRGDRGGGTCHNDKPGLREGKRESKVKGEGERRDLPQ